MIEERKNKLDGVFDKIIPKKEKQAETERKVSKPDEMETIKKQGNATKRIRILRTYTLEKEIADKVKAYAYWERSDISDVVNSILKAFVRAVEKEQGAIETIPIKHIRPVKSIKIEKSSVGELGEAKKEEVPPPKKDNSKEEPAQERKK